MINKTIKSLLSLIIVFSLNNLALASNITEEVKSYIINIKSIAVDFEQRDSEGNMALGTLIIDKPHKFRCNYYEPFPLLMIGNVNYVSVYDYDMENLSRIPARENVFNFLLVDKIDFSKQFEILSAKKHDNDYVIKMLHLESGRLSEISFDHTTKHIKQLTIFEEDNVINIKFGKTHNIQNIDKELFKIQDPDIFGKPGRFNKSQLEKKYHVNIKTN